MTLLWECGRIRNCIRLLTGTMWVRYPPLLLLCRYSLTARTLGFHPRDRSSILRSDTFCEVDCWSSNLSHKQVYEGSIPSFATFLFFWLPNIDLDVIILMSDMIVDVVIDVMQDASSNLAASTCQTKGA